MSSHKSAPAPLIEHIKRLFVDEHGLLLDIRGHIGGPRRKRLPKPNTAPEKHDEKAGKANGHYLAKGKSNDMAEYEELSALNKAAPGWDKSARQQVRRRLNELGLSPSQIKKWMGEAEGN